MSDTDTEDDLSSAGGESDESGSENQGGFFDIEAEETDGYDNNSADGSDAYEHDSTYLFERFSLLPTELRHMIWEQVDPYLKTKGRVFTVTDSFGEDEIEDGIALDDQTAPARTLLSINRESRAIALKYYPDVFRIQKGRGHVRFNRNYDVVHLVSTNPASSPVFRSRACEDVKYLAIHSDNWPHRIETGALSGMKSLEAVFFLLDGNFLAVSEREIEKRTGYRQLEWSVSDSARKFHIPPEAPDSERGDDMVQLFCWPDTTQHATFADLVGEDHPLMNHVPSKFGSAPVWGMVEFTFNRGVATYHKIKNRYMNHLSGDAEPASPSSSEGTSAYESELDEYEVDGFVVDSSDRSEQASDDEGGHDSDDGDDVEPSHVSINSEDLSGDERDGEDDLITGELDSFNGFSPIQDDLSDTDGGGRLPEATFSSLEPESPEGDITHASSPRELPHRINQSVGSKRKIILSDDEDGDEDGRVSEVQIRSRANKRARVVVSDSEDDDDDEDDDEDDKIEKRQSRNKQVAMEDQGEDDDEDSEEESDEEEEVDGEETEQHSSKALSLMARLRQFRSEVPASPEGDSSDTIGNEADGGDYDDYDEGGGGRLSDAEFPDSAEEENDYGEDDRW
ncbi:hypothetical protein GGS20DRAFT_552406 [Poronia punctata]|nr:hypothetical protein GGS20DRAFT_552406 [Poronia punctata]